MFVSPPPPAPSFFQSFDIVNGERGVEGEQEFRPWESLPVDALPL